MDDGFSAPESYVAFGTFAGFDPTSKVCATASPLEALHAMAAKVPALIPA